MILGIEHQQVTKLSMRAEALMEDGERPEAMKLYRQAASLEEVVLDGCDETKPVTLGAMALSTAALYYKAGERENARRIAAQYVDNPHLSRYYRDSLREILEECQ